MVGKQGLKSTHAKKETNNKIAAKSIDENSSREEMTKRSQRDNDSKNISNKMSRLVIVSIFP